MEDFQRFSLLTFPQAFDGNSLTLNIVVLPRNQNPLVAAIDGEPALAGAPAFADARLSFVARVVSGLAGLPGAVPALAPRKAPVVRPGSARSIFEALGEQFTITDKSAPNTELNLSALNNRPVSQQSVRSTSYVAQTAVTNGQYTSTTQLIPASLTTNAIVRPSQESANSVTSQSMPMVIGVIRRVARSI